MSAEARLLEVERDRQHLIDEFIADYGADGAGSYRPGSFGCHELLDRTALAAELLEQKVLNHPACFLNQEWFSLAEQAVEILNELYQRVGEAHVAKDGPENTP
jgi:hypothetical protein